MAEWRVLGYVPDSDEEDDLQCASLPKKPTIDEGFLDIDDIEKDGVEKSTVEENQNHEVVPRSCDGLGDGNKENKSQRGRFVAVAIELPHLHRPTSGDADLDELQQDHYTPQPAARPISRLSTNIDDALALSSKVAATPKLNAVDGLVMSSPLTELSSSPSLQNFLASTNNTEPKTFWTFNAPNSINPLGPDRFLAPSPQENPSGFREEAHLGLNNGSRNLRHRNPIQLHPYAIESEKYRQVLKARGLKPLRIAQGQEDFASLTGQETQELDFQIEEESQLQDSNVESQFNVNSSPSYDYEKPAVTLVGAANPSQVDDELPEVDVLLRTLPTENIGRAAKRRKIMHASSSTAREHSKEENVHLQSQRASPFGGEDAENDRLTIPPSPPQSENSTLLKPTQPARPGFRIPSGLSPDALPTPITSSEPRREFALPRIESAKMFSKANVLSSDEDNPGLSDSGSSSSADEANIQLKRVQRKLRGVLPASWLKIDLKSRQQPSKPSLRNHQSLSPRAEERKGVAKHLNAPRKKDPDTVSGNGFPILISDDEGPYNDLVESTNAKTLVSNLRHFDESNDVSDDDQFLYPFQGEVLEDNRIDEMIPKRSKTYSKRRKKAQRRLLGGDSKKIRFTDLKPSSSLNTFAIQPKITDRFGRSPKRKTSFCPPRLSILDTTASDKSTPMPTFLKVASRTARSRRDKGRHSPSHKFVRLATKDDTHDATETLRNWREGTIAPATSLNSFSHKPLHRHPLASQSGNLQTPMRAASSSGIVKARQNFSFGTKLLDVNPRPVKKAQSSLDGLISRTTKSTDHRHSRIKKFLKPIKRTSNRGQMLSSLQHINNSRPATLESVEGADRRNTPISFQKHLLDANRKAHQPTRKNIILDRFFEDGNGPLSIETQEASTPNERYKAGQASSAGQKNEHRLMKRKRQPHRINVNAPEFHQISPVSLINASVEDQDFREIQDTTVLTGLASFGARYTQTFDVTPLPIGTFFHSGTFIGSGAFSRSSCYKTEGRDKSRGFAIIRHENDIVRWGPWNDAVSTQLGSVLDEILGIALSPNKTDKVAFERLKSSQLDILGYLVDHLSFLDSVDRNSFLQKCKGLIASFLSKLDAQSKMTEQVEDFRLQIRTLILCITNILYQISQQEVVQSVLKAEFSCLLLEIARKNLCLALNEQFRILPQCLENLKHLEACEYGIRENSGSIEAIVVAHHVFRESPESLQPFWTIAMDSILTKETKNTTDIHVMEAAWRKLFTILPFLEFDIQGIIHAGQRFIASNDNWPLVKQLINRVFQFYLENPSGQGSTFNAYCRSLLHRCLHLMNSWGWRRSQLIVGTLFDFFARNDLAHLRNEESHGSPNFLEKLDSKPQLDASYDDRSFHVFLKILGGSLHYLRIVFPEKKIRDIVWRLMPNHGRLHPKEEAIHQRDLDALRNHHDLLCTLYWASPSAARPRLTVIRNLVDIEFSHREAIHINIRAWSNLVRFQLSTDEPLSNLESFVEWHDSILKQLLQQHQYARSEAENYVRLVEASGVYVSQGLLETTIARNQQQTAAILGDALISLKIAMENAKGLEQASILLTPALPLIFDLFDSRKSQTYKVIGQALDVVLAYTRHFIQTNFQIKSNDDSQDYGDWSAFEDTDVYTVNQQNPQYIAAVKLQTEFYEPLKQLLSNSFGADTIPEDAVLSKITEAWVSLSRVLNRHGLKSWDDYLAQFGHDSWSSLRQTEQARKYQALYLALMLEDNQGIYKEYQENFQNFWIQSLVERESMIKYQHRLTTAMLNLDLHNPLLQNVPFWIGPNLDRFEVTYSEFLERRLSLISCILSNMRQTIETTSLERSTSLPGLKQEYANLLKHLMTTMKSNFQELGTGSNTKDTYVDFVHRIIEFLQQHTSEICPIDRFFTDSATFPLPTTDPTYVTGRLKNYGLRLQDSRTPKQLAVFLQSVSERAAVDGQQAYLESQLYAAMAGASENGQVEKPTLQAFLVKAILPAYIEIAFSTSCGWLLALPILRALRSVFQQMLTGLDGTNPASVKSVIDTATAFLRSARTSMDLLVVHSGLLEQVHILQVLAVIYSGITALLPILDYIIRLASSVQQHQQQQEAIHCIEFSKSFATFAHALLQKIHDRAPPSPDLDGYLETAAVENPYVDIQDFTLRELRSSLARNWAVHDGRFYLARGNARREVVVQNLSFEQIRESLFVAFEAFFRFLGMLPSFEGQEGNCMSRSKPLRIEKNFDLGLGNCVF